MITLMIILIVVNVFSILYIRILIKENWEMENQLYDELSRNLELEDELLLQKRLTKTFEKGYTDLKLKQNGK
jgi:hypothetical protein